MCFFLNLVLTHLTFLLRTTTFFFKVLFRQKTNTLAVPLWFGVPNKDWVDCRETWSTPSVHWDRGGRPGCWVHRAQLKAQEEEEHLLSSELVIFILFFRLPPCFWGCQAKGLSDPLAWRPCQANSQWGNQLNLTNEALQNTQTKLAKLSSNQAWVRLIEARFEGYDMFALEQLKVPFFPILFS